MGKWKSCCDKPLADLGLSSKALIRCPRPDLLPVTRDGTVLINAVPRVQVQGQILNCGDCLFVPGFVRISTLHFTLLFPQILARMVLIKSTFDNALAMLT